MAASTEPRGCTALPPLRLEAATALLAPPRLPMAAAAAVPLACRAATAAIPVLLAVPAGAGRVALARALHTLAGREGPLLATAGRRPPLTRLPAGTSLYLDLGVLAAEALVALEAVLDDGLVWLLIGNEPGRPLPSQLAARLTPVVLEVPPLASRRAELPVLAEAALATLAARAGAPPPRLALAARERLAMHAWPGDLAELEAVLAGAFLRLEGDVIEPGDLVFQAVPRAPAAAPAPPDATAPARTVAHDAELEFVLGELAHELRNPMVTLKTYAQHLPALLEDAELRTRFERLAAEAIDRMDGLLENVLTFARLERPRPEAVALGPLLERVVTEIEPELTRRGLRMRPSAAPTAHCAADPEQLVYALRNLFAGVIREVPAGEEVACEATANGVVTLRFAAGAEAPERLRRLAAPGDSASLADPTLLPLAFRLARGVLERNGGGLAVMPEGGRTATVVVRLPMARGEET